MAVESKGTALRGLDDDELAGKLTEAREELFNLKFQSATGQLENTSRLKLVRREIARIHTIRHERTLGIHPAGAEPAESGRPDDADRAADDTGDAQ